MARKYTNILVHVVLSTKEHRSLIPPELERKLWRYIDGIGANCRIPVLAVGGMPNHIHTLIALASDIALAKAVQTIIKFAWQEGYGAFSVSASNRCAVKDYIRHQPEHHARRSFEDEFVGLLRKSGVAYNPAEVFG